MEVTFEYYEKTFYGETIAESDFPKWLKRAEDKLNLLTFEQITKEAETEYADKISHALCALADAMYLVDAERRKASDTTAKENIKSMSSGGESISFETRDTVYKHVLVDKRAENALYRREIAEHLQGTYLLYAGC